MRTTTIYFPRLMGVIAIGLFFIFTSLNLNAQEECGLQKSLGQGYYTTISSVTNNGYGSYTIVLVVKNECLPGSACPKLVNFSVEADPGTYSGIAVQALSGPFTYGGINYGPTLPNTPFQGFRVTTINGMGNGQVASFSITYTLSGGLQDQRVQAKAGNSYLNASFSLQDFQAVMDCQGQNIIPYYPPPEGGKVNDLIGAELTSLYYTFDSTGSYISDDIFQIVGSSVLIDIIADNGKYDSALAILISPEYGMTSYSGNPDELIITGLFPILNLLSLNDLPSLINFARPVYPALGNSGIVTSQGDTSLRSYISRTGFEVTGQGIKIGVMSDSYNTRLGDPAADDILRGDLPGSANPDYPLPVDIVKEYPYGARSDEGRAMLQIVHDVAPGAELAFRTGFLGPADFAKGILELQQADCDIIVDDITYISEPFFRDGIVARAVDSVHSLGVTYFSAAGNFGTKAYQSEFYPSAPPQNISGFAHNFAAPDGGTDIYQSITLAQGNYTVVFQWDDGSPGNITNSDFDIYLSNENGTTLFGFNRVNTGGAPLEVLPFTVTAASAQTNFMIIRASGTGAATLKYIIFRGDIQVNEYATSGASTLVGQANAAGALAVGAVLYSNSPEYGVDLPTVASFSSRGGTPVNGINRNKPEITAPNGVNTTVDLGGYNLDGDAFPNFFGTSAAAPHAAAVAALVQEARQKYYGSSLSPEEMKVLLQNSAIDMYTPGYDAASGAGFIQVDAALGTLANPSPSISGIYYDTTLTPGIDPIEITIFGRLLTSGSHVYFNGQPLESPSIIQGDTAVTSVIPVFSGRYPMIQVYNPPMEGTNGTDGGLSNPLYFTSKETIVINIDDKSKKYGEVMPGFTATYYIENEDGDMPLDSADLSQEEIDRIQGIAFETIATALSNTGLWEIKGNSNDPLNPESGLPVVDPLDISLLERYNIGFESGLLTIDKLDLVISPKDDTVTYGEEIGGFDFDFYFNNDSVNLDYGFQISEADSLAILSTFSQSYATALVNYTALVNASSFITATALVNKSMMISNATFNKFATALVNGTFISPPSFQTATALVNTVTFTGVSALAPATALVNGDVVVNGFSVSGATALVNASMFINAFAGATALVNATTVNANNNSDAIVILGGDDIRILSGDSTGFIDMRGINLVTGNTVGQHFIVPGSYVSNNYNISYLPGILTVLPASAEVIIDTAGLTQTYGGIARTVSVTTVPAGLDVIVTYDSLPSGPVNAGSYIVQALVADSNYTGEATDTLVITPVNATVTAQMKVIKQGDPLPDFTATFSGFVGGDDASDVESLTFTVSPAYSGQPGTYTIIPAAVAQNYIFTPVTQPMYVNPYNNNAKQVLVYIVCVEPLNPPDTSGFTYLAHFSYQNANATDVYIPFGADNSMSGSGSFNGAGRPKLFKAGGGTFTIPFNGVLFSWTVKSYKKLVKTSSVARASSASEPCYKSEEAEAPVIPVAEAGEPHVYPNPTTGRIYIDLNGEDFSSDNVRIFDIYGKAQALQVITSSDRQIELDFSSYAAGMYFISISDGETTTVSRVIKK